MIAKQEKLPRLTDLEQAIKHGFVQRTLGRIRVLEVEVADNLLVIRGCAASFHLKQLAIQGALDVVATGCSSPIAIDVRIAANAPLSDANVPRGAR